MYKTTLYRTKKGTWTNRKTSQQFEAAMWNESFRREYPDATEPTAWGLRNNVTGALSRVAASRDAARSLRKPTETVVAIWA